MKKTWIKLKRGLLEPKHRKKLGVRVWLYLYILDQADWETGKIFDWRDKYAADDLGMPHRTVQDQRQQLDYDGYISCIQSGDHQIITIHKWTNPREYSGFVYNQDRKGTESSVSQGVGTENTVPQDLGGTGEGTGEGNNNTVPVHLSSHITYQRGQPNIFELYEQEIGVLSSMISDTLKEWEDSYPYEWIVEAIQIAVENNARRANYVEAILKRWETEGKDSGRGKKSIKKTLEEEGYLIHGQS